MSNLKPMNLSTFEPMLTLLHRPSHGAEAARKSTLALVLQVVLPVTVGGLIYLLFRPPVLLMFDWAKSLGVGSAIMEARGLATPLVAYMPGWLTNSLPNGLWAFSLACAMRWIWFSDPRLSVLVPTAIVLILGVFPEVLQGLGSLPGTFDLFDLFLCVALGCAGLVTPVHISGRRLT